MTPNQSVRVEADEGVAVVTIDRPEALNALNRDVLVALVKAIDEVEQNKSIRVLVLKGAGEKAFVAGADISEMKEMSSAEATTFAKLGQSVCERLETLSKPSIALVNGFALGGGTELALGCDFILASDSATFGLPEVSLGVIPGFGGTFRLTKRVGAALAKELIFSGRRVKADEALRIGLVNQVVPKETLLSEGKKLALTIAQNSATAIAAAKALIRDAYGADFAARADAEALSFGGLFAQADQVEGMKAFSEKRKPKFK